MYSEDVATSLIVVGDQIFEVHSTDEMEQPYYIVKGGKDFSFFQQKVPGIFFNLGGMKKGGDPATTPSHHTPDFYLDESGFKLGVQAIANIAVDYMEMGQLKK